MMQKKYHGKQIKYYFNSKRYACHTAISSADVSITEHGERKPTHFRSWGAEYMVHFPKTVSPSSTVVFPLFVVYTPFMKIPEKPTCYIIDGNSYIYRAYYAIKQLSTSKGLPTNAVFGFANMLLKVMSEKKPDYLAIAFDPPGKTRRHGVYQEYKSHRPPMPRDLVPQIPYIHRLVEAFRIPVFLIEGQEADDVIATLSRRAAAEGMEVTVVSGDKDLLQLVSPRISVYDSLKEKIYDAAAVEERWGVPPDRIVEILGLMGDASDNIPGVPGVGEKTAQSLIREYGTIENLLNRAAEIKKPKLRQSLLENSETARLSRDLATLHSELPMEIDFQRLAATAYDGPVLLSLLRELEFTSLLRLVTTEPETKAEYRIILNEKDLVEAITEIKTAGRMCLDTETTSLDPLRAELVGISFTAQAHEAWYLPLRHSYEGVPAQISVDQALSALRPLLEDASLPKIGQNLKYDLQVLRGAGIELAGISFDTMIASYVLNPSKQSHSLDSLALEFLNYKALTYAEVTGTGKKQKSFAEVDLETATRYSGEDADIALRIQGILEPQLREQGLDSLFRDVEMPLMSVLADMEYAGVRIDSGLLADMSGRLERETSSIIRTIYELAGTEFNINSPKQLADVLFVKLGLAPVKRTKTGLSTNVDVLEELSLVHPLPAEILKYRTLAKLKSTYVDALPLMVNPKTGRLHTSLNQTVIATGRLSSSDPNLQNIPIRTEVGREIRKAFIADEGCSLLSSDYSQIELRILAHLSADPALIETFASGEDIHTRTASEIFGLPPEEVTTEMRRKAKAVNFGIIYGISAFGLAQDIGVSNIEAKRYIDNYFARYPKVREFLDRTIADAKTKGYVTTLLGRKRYIPELTSSTAPVRNFGERMAVNTPIQGTAADLIKLAMIHIHRAIKEQRLQSRMLLQVHDELIFDVPEAELDTMKALVRKSMEEVLTLSVPIKVDMGAGKNWEEAH